MARQAEGEVVLQLLGVMKIGAMNVLPTGDYPEESIGCATKVGQASRFGSDAGRLKIRSVLAT